ncbi:MAG: GNAT family N-acetyltransferase [Pseudomonadota bacterium]|nr:GNAT family N-acetyltransferase [Pseudomonadota bacterium]
MNNTVNIDIQNKDILEKGQFENQKLDFQIVALTSDDIQTMLIFQALILGALEPGEEGYFLEKDESFFKKHFNSGSKAIGVVTNGHLIGQALIVHPNAQNPKTGMTDMDLPEPVESISVIQGVGAHPESRGLKVGDKLIKAWLDVAANDNRYNALAETDQHNYYSWQLFVKNGVDIVSEGLDQSDGTKLYNHHKVLKL